MQYAWCLGACPEPPLRTNGSGNAHDRRCPRVTLARERTGSVCSLFGLIRFLYFVACLKPYLTLCIRVVRNSNETASCDRYWNGFQYRCAVAV